MWFSSIFIPQRACMQVEPQAIEYNKREEFNLSLFRKLGTPTLALPFAEVLN